MGKLKNSPILTKTKIFKKYIELNYYSDFGIPNGQTPAQVPQSMHLSESIIYLFSPGLIQETGHAPAQAPHLTQPSPITYGIEKPPFILLLFL